MAGEKSSRKSSKAKYLGLLPIILFCFAFEAVPIFTLIKESLLDKSGELTTIHYQGAFSAVYLRSFGNSIKLSALTALLGTLLGVLIGYHIYTWPNKKVQNMLITLSDVTTNFAGAPLAFGFIIILGSTGVITKFLLNYFNWKIYPDFSIYSFTGLVLAYTYFQLPLMVLLIIPAFSGLRSEWREAATNLGAGTFDYWRRIGIPILTPSIVAGYTLLFANAFGAYATAFTLIGLRFPLITMQIGQAISGDALKAQGAGQALAVVSLCIMTIAITVYQLSTNKARRWQSR